MAQLNYQQRERILSLLQWLLEEHHEIRDEVVDLNLDRTAIELSDALGVILACMLALPEPARRVLKSRRSTEDHRKGRMPWPRLEAILMDLGGDITASERAKLHQIYATSLSRYPVEY